MKSIFKSNGARLRIYNFLLEAFTLNSFSYVVAMPIEIWIAGMSPLAHFKVRLVGLLLNTVLGRPYGKWRTYMFKKFGISFKSTLMKKYFVDTSVFLSFQLPLYLASTVFGGCGFMEILKASIIISLISGFSGRPYGFYLDSARKLFGLGIEYCGKSTNK